MMEIKGMELIDAVLNEFWHRHPELYGDYMHLLGHRISHVGSKTIDQEDYLKEWLMKENPTDEEIREAMEKRRRCEE